MADLPNNQEEWIRHLDEELRTQGGELSEIARQVAGLSAQVGTLIEQQKSLFGRANRPMQWGAIISGVSLIGICAGLLIAPIRKDIDQQQDFTRYAVDKMIAEAERNGRQDEAIKWMEDILKGVRP